MVYDEHIISDEKLQSKCEDMVYRLDEIVFVLMHMDNDFTKQDYVDLRRALEILDGPIKVSTEETETSLTKMTLEQVVEQEEIGEVMTSEDFVEQALSGCLIPDDGSGYLHDGYKGTDIDCFDLIDPSTNACIDFDKYPYVIWYNK